MKISRYEQELEYHDGAWALSLGAGSILIDDQGDIWLVVFLVNHDRALLKLNRIPAIYSRLPDRKFAIYPDKVWIENE